jgi:hypothetical protein
MIRAWTLAAPAAMLVATLLPEPASAQPVGAAVKPTATVALVYPLTVVKKADMDFGYLSAATAGTAVLDPNANTLTTTGGVQAMGGTPTAAEFIGASQSSAVVNIKLPTQAIMLTRVGGTETMRLDDWTLQGQSKRTLARMSSFDFRVGGTLYVAAGQVEGYYTGTFDITVQYP